MSVVSIFKRRIFTRKVIYRSFQLDVWTFQKCKNAHACPLRDCLGVSRLFVSDTSPKCIDREGLERRRIRTRQGSFTSQKNHNRESRAVRRILRFVVLIPSSETQGQIKGARESLNGRKNIYGTKKSKERREEPLGTMSYQTSSKRSVYFSSCHIFPPV